MIVVSIQRQDVISIDYINENIGANIEHEKSLIVNDRGLPLNMKTLDNGAVSMNYYHEDFGHETIMVCKV